MDFPPKTGLGIGCKILIWLAVVLAIPIGIYFFFAIWWIATT